VIGGGGLLIFDFAGDKGLGGRGATQHSKIYNIFFSDISLITRISNSLVSHFL